jgi:hypothetical protein
MRAISRPGANIAGIQPGTASRRFWENHRIALTKPIVMKALPYAGKEKSCRRWIALQI